MTRLPSSATSRHGAHRRARLHRRGAGSRTGLFPGLSLLPWSALRILLVMGLAIKALLILEMGEERYRARLAAYDGDSLGERLGVMMMTPDPVSLKLRDIAMARLRGPPRLRARQAAAATAPTGPDPPDGAAPAPPPTPTPSRGPPGTRWLRP